uniref:Uncharacterized protein n=1 Tax=Mammaliicoccus phage MSShimriz1 TaxID=3230127 RepID=A0AAU8GTG7_9VIRU
MKIEYIDLVLENCDVVRLEPNQVNNFYIEEVTETMSFYGESSDGVQHKSNSKRCKYFSIEILNSREILQTSFSDMAFDLDRSSVYEMITNYSDITAVDLIYKDGTNDYIYVDFNEFNDNYNINQKEVEYGSILRVTVTEKNSVRENLS